MDRRTAILNAQVLRYNHITFDVQSCIEKHHEGQVPHYSIKSQEKADEKGKVKMVTSHHVKFKQGPSISEAKRNTRGLRCVKMDSKEYLNWVEFFMNAKAKEA